MQLTVTAYRQIEPEDKTAARSALKVAGIRATVRSGSARSASRWTLTISTNERTAQERIDAAITPLGFKVHSPANHLTNRFYYRIPDGTKIRNPD